MLFNTRRERRKITEWVRASCHSLNTNTAVIITRQTRRPTRREELCLRGEFRGPLRTWLGVVADVACREHTKTIEKRKKILTPQHHVKWLRRWKKFSSVLLTMYGWWRERRALREDEWAEPTRKKGGDGDEAQKRNILDIHCKCSNVFEELANYFRQTTTIFEGSNLKNKLITIKFFELDELFQDPFVLECKRK